MIELLEAADEIQQYLQLKKWAFCFIGGLALLRWGEPRFTQDVDLTLYTGFHDEEKYIQDIISEFSSRIEDLADFALRNRVLLIQSSTGIPIDVSLGGLPFEAEMIERSTFYPFSDKYLLKTCTAEGLIIMKSFADRARDWGDIETILIRQAGKIDWPYVYSFLNSLCEVKGDSLIPQRLDALRQKFNA